MSVHSAAIGRLAAEDSRLRAAHGTLTSLAPGRAEVTRLAEMGECWLTDRVHPAAGEVFADAAIEVAQAQARNFPENLFWDFDLPARSIFELAIGGDAAALPETRRVLVMLQERFGVLSPIRFRYVHDFIYGFDWARWVRRSAVQRQSVGPFDRCFLGYTLQRGSELLELIAADDAKYPKIGAGARRNPFGFSREPADEARLLRDLAERELIPVRAWDAFSRPIWDRPFSRLREERAEALGLAGAAS
jgi:hypothetical protein